MFYKSRLYMLIESGEQLISEQLIDRALLLPSSYRGMNFHP